MCIGGDLKKVASGVRVCVVCVVCYRRLGLHFKGGDDDSDDPIPF